MKNSLSKNLIERYSRQIVLKDVGVAGQKTIIKIGRASCRERV